MVSRTFPSINSVLRWCNSCEGAELFGEIGGAGEAAVKCDVCHWKICEGKLLCCQKKPPLACVFNR